MAALLFARPPQTWQTGGLFAGQFNKPGFFAFNCDSLGMYDVSSSVAQPPMRITTEIKMIVFIIASTVARIRALCRRRHGADHGSNCSSREL